LLFFWIFKGEKVKMPVVMISKNDGTLLKEFLFSELKDLTNNEDKKVFVSITFNKVILLILSANWFAFAWFNL